MPKSSNKPECEVDGCEKPQMARGYCPGHYRRNKLYGDPLAGAPSRQPSAAQSPKPGKAGARAGVTSGPELPGAGEIEQRKGERPTVKEIQPLLSTYGIPKPEGCYFDEDAAQHAVDWIEGLRHFKGRWVGQPFYLMEWQDHLIREIFGWKNEDGTRLHRLVYVEAPRKTGKTTLAAAIALYLAHGDEEAAPEVYFAAYDKDQAKIAYEAARLMTAQHSELDRVTTTYLSRNEMILRNNPGGFMRILSRESAKQFGLNIHGLIFDELMTQKSREMWNAVTTAEGSREQPLSFCISTAGWDLESVCFEQHSRVENIVNGTAEPDPSFLGVIYGADIDADWTDEKVWAAANPSLGETASIAFYRRKSIEAKNQPTEQNAFRTLLLSQWVGQAERFLDIDVWDACQKKPGATAQRPAFGGLDLSTTTDMTAFVVVAENSKGELDIYPHVFLPEANLAERERRARAPYSTWAREGLLTLTPGAVVDYEYVKATILGAQEQFDLRDISYDRWNSSQLVTQLEEEGFEMVKIGQGFAGLSAPTKELLRMAVDEKLCHGGHPVLRWCANAVAVQTDPAGNVKPDKSRSSQKIDPIVALILAIDGWMRRGRELKKVSPYSKHDLAVA